MHEHLLIRIGKPSNPVLYALCLGWRVSEDQTVRARGFHLLYLAKPHLFQACLHWPATASNSPEHMKCWRRLSHPVCGIC